MDDAPVVLARHRGERGELALRRRGDVLELVVDGVFAMDSAHTATEQALAELALARLDDRHDPDSDPDDDLDIVVAGLGLGYTCRSLLDHPRVRRVRVIELHAVLVDWMRAGLVPGAELLADDRLEVRIADVADAVPALAPASVDAVLLDVDNGPGFLVHADNARLYGWEFLAAAARALRPGGLLGIWSADPAPDLLPILDAACGPTEEVLLDVRRDGRQFRYAIYLARRTASTTPSTGPEN